MARDLTLAEASEELSIHEQTLRQLLRKGKFRGAYKTGTGGRSSPWRIPPAAITHYRSRQPQGYRAA